MEPLASVIFTLRVVMCWYVIASMQALKRTLRRTPSFDLVSKIHSSFPALRPRFLRSSPILHHHTACELYLRQRVCSRIDLGSTQAHLLRATWSEAHGRSHRSSMPN